MFIAVNLIIAFALLTGFIAADDDPVLTKIISSIHQWNDSYPTEKVYLQLDKPYYAAGDNIWFKAYVVAKNNGPSSLSGVLNVELINNRDSVSNYIKLPVTNGTAVGDFALPDNLKTGKYRIRAYTNWMRNAGPDYYFDKTIVIGNSTSFKQQKNNTETPEEKHQPDIQFFPESGSLVTGLRSKIAVKIVGPNGLGLDATGTIIDDDNNTVSNFSTQHLGMGIFALAPQPGKTYKALMTFANGLKTTVNLPKPADNGYVLTINNTDTASVNVKVAGNNENNGPLYLIAQSGGEVLYIANNKAATGKVFSVNIPTSKFPSGIVQLTLFSATGDPLNERVVFVQHKNDLLNLSISGNLNTSIRDKYRLDLFSEAMGKPVAGNFSVAVIDENKVPADQTDETTILSYLLLTSDLRGYIEKPAYYFENTTEKSRADLDVLMLTQGYRRFTWKPILASAFNPPLYKPEKELVVSGFVTNPWKKPMPHAKVSLFSHTNGYLFVDTVADENGRFTLNNLPINDSTHYTIQVRTPKNSSYAEVTLDNQTADVVNKNPVYESFTDNSLFNYLKYSKELSDEEIKYGVGNHTIVLKQVNVRAKQQKPVLTYSSNISGAGNADLVFTNDMISKYGVGTLEEYLRTRLTNVTFFEGIPYTSRNWSLNTMSRAPMSVLINGVQSYNGVADLMTSDVGSVEVIKNANRVALFGPTAMNGLLIINLKNALDVSNSQANHPTPDVLRFTPKGYYASREFYSPQYDDPKTNTILADLRSTIYWNPNLITDDKGRASVEYYNAGSAGTYRVIIEGMDANGHLGRQVFKYKVDDTKL